MRATCEAVGAQAQSKRGLLAEPLRRQMNELLG
jgi:hypothetical protein